MNLNLDRLIGIKHSFAPRTREVAMVQVLVTVGQIGQRDIGPWLLRVLLHKGTPGITVGELTDVLKAKFAKRGDKGPEASAIAAEIEFLLVKGLITYRESEGIRLTHFGRQVAEKLSPRQVAQAT